MITALIRNRILYYCHINLGIEADQEVGIYVDIEKRCKKGATDFTGLKTELIAIGVLKMTRNQLFKQCVERSVIKTYLHLHIICNLIFYNMANFFTVV